MHYFCVESWWRHQMESFSALLAICAGNSPVTGEFPAQRPVTWSFNVFFDLRLINGWGNNGEAGDLRCHHTHYDLIVMYCRSPLWRRHEVPNLTFHICMNLYIHTYLSDKNSQCVYSLISHYTVNVYTHLHTLYFFNHHGHSIWMPGIKGK